MLRVWEVVFERFGFFNRSKADLLHGQKSSRGKEDDEKLNEEIDPPIFATKKSSFHLCDIVYLGLFVEYIFKAKLIKSIFNYLKL